MMFLPFFVTASLLLTHAFCATPYRERKIRRAPHAPNAALEVTSNYVEIVPMKPAGRSRGLSAAHAAGYTAVPLQDLEVEEEWAAMINFGGEEVLVILDTGSSDTWLAMTGFQCVNINMTDLPEADCNFGPLYNGTFTEGEISNENFNISYGDGEFLTGNMGYTDVSIGSITVKHQEVALVTEAYWEGDNLTSGLIGLAYSALTSAYAGTNATLDNFNKTGNATGDQEPYSPIVQTMISQGLNPPLFSLALMRSANTAYDVAGGYVAFGGLPPVSVNPMDFVSTPILIHEFYEYPLLEATVRSFYTIKPDGYVYNNKHEKAVNHKTKQDAVVDSGTTLLYIPDKFANGYIDSFDPPATLFEGSYFYPCDATAPEFGIKIAGIVFNIDSADIILPDSGFTDNTTGVEYCLIGILPGGVGDEALTIFGDVFLKNVVAVFDVGASLMRFAPHVY